MEEPSEGEDVEEYEDVGPAVKTAEDHRAPTTEHLVRMESFKRAITSTDSDSLTLT